MSARPLLRGLGRLVIGDCTVYSLEYGGPAAAEDWRVLSPDERSRANRFVSIDDAHRFVARRAMLRRVLAEELDRRPESVRFASGVRGKPVVVDNSDALLPVCFSTSATDRYAVVAVAARALGVDIEAIQRCTWDESVASRVLSDREIQWVRGQVDRDRAFTECWVRKEAFAKLVGTGLDESVAQTTLTPECDGGIVQFAIEEPWVGTLLALATASANTQG
jgi:4'-phosphopantetheinyl transferase